MGVAHSPISFWERDVVSTHETPAGESEERSTAVQETLLSACVVYEVWVCCNAGTWWTSFTMLYVFAL